MPPMARQLELAEAAVLTLARGEGDNPPKTALHTRDEAFLHAMPAYHRPSDQVGLKWVSGYPENRAHGLPYIMGLIVLNDPETGRPLCIMDAREITGFRTAAISGVAIRALPRRRSPRWPIVGTGAQAQGPSARARAPAAAVRPRRLRCGAPRRSRRSPRSRRDADAVRSVRIVASIPEAIAEADLLMTAGTTYAHFQNQIRPEAMKPDVLIDAVDWSTLIPGGDGAGRRVRSSWTTCPSTSTTRGSAWSSSGYPDEARSLGDLVVEGVTRETRPTGLLIAMPIGVAMTDVLYAHEVLRRAEELGIGLELEA